MQTEEDYWKGYFLSEGIDKLFINTKSISRQLPQEEFLEELTRAEFTQKTLEQSSTLEVDGTVMRRGLNRIKNSVIDYLTRLPVAKFAAADATEMNNHLKESKDFRDQFEKFAFESATAAYDSHVSYEFYTTLMDKF